MKSPLIRRVALGAVILAVIWIWFWPWFVYVRAAEKGQAAMKSAYQIHQALFAYAKCHDQHFPTGEHNSNEAYRELFKEGLVDDERLFYVEGSAWHGGKPPDGEIGGTADNFAQALGPGENHWAYGGSGLNSEKDDSTTPIVMDGFTDTPGIWTEDPTKRGGVWGREYHIIVNIGGSAKVVDTAAPGQSELKYTGKLLNPDPPKP